MYNILMKNLLLVLVVFVACINAETVNVLTTFYVNQDQFKQNIVCTDCVQPVTINAEGLPEFMTLTGNTLQAVAPPVPGQYHVSLNIKDGVGQTAQVLVVLLCQDNKTIPTNTTTTTTPTTTPRQGDTIISIYSPQLLANLTSLLLNPNTLTQTQAKIQTILAKQAAINNKIANLLILIRRYSGKQNQNTNTINNLTKQIQNLIPKQSSTNQQLLNLEGKLSQNRQSIQDLLDFIKLTRQSLIQQNQQHTQYNKQYQQILNQTHNKYAKQMQLQAIIALRKQMLTNLTEANNNANDGCQQNAIDQQNNLVNQYDNQNNKLIVLLAGANDQIQSQNSLIQDLKRQLDEAERKRNQAMKSKYEFMGNITTIEKLKQSALNKIKQLEQMCKNTPTIDPQTLKKLQDLITQLQNQLKTINNDISQLEPQLSQLFDNIQKTTSQINLKNILLDQAITDVETLYTDNDNINIKISSLKKQKEEVDGQLQKLRLDLELFLRNTQTNNQALKNAKEELAKALMEKEVNDGEIQNLLYSNLDIIRSVQGQGNYNFDAQKIAKIVGFDSKKLDFSNIYTLNHTKSGNQSCTANVIFYGLGKIKSVSPGQIITVNSSGQQVVLRTPTCSINMATKQNYVPQEGDAICWKGHRINNQWIISQSIVIPAKV